MPAVCMRAAIQRHLPHSVLQEWDDMFLVWDPKDYGGLEVLRLPCHKIWLPDIVLYNK